MLTNLSGLMDKAEAFAGERKFSADNYVGLRLAPDMNPFSFQIQAATDRSKLFLARVAGREAPRWPDDEKTFAELRERLQKGIDYIAGFKEADFAGADDRLVPLKVRGQDVQWSAEKYLFENAYPNFFFHVTTAYNILRHAGVVIGKRDFTG
jgi:hypothetical protein